MGTGVTAGTTLAGVLGGALVAEIAVVTGLVVKLGTEFFKAAEAHAEMTIETKKYLNQAKDLKVMQM